MTNRADPASPRPGRSRLGGVGLIAVAVVLGAPCVAAAAPDPTLAPLISVASTLAPIAVTTGLWLGGRGVSEGIRFDLGLVFLGLGAIVGPSIGQIYAEGGSDAWVSFVLRAITGSIMVTGVGLAVRGEEGVQSAGTALAVVSGIPTVFLAAYDTIGASSSAIAAARRQGHGPRADLAPPIIIAGLSLCSALAGSPCPTN